MRKYPILLAGWGIRRWEYIGGKEVDYKEYERKFLWDQRPSDNGPGPSHLQKFTKWGPGFLITIPFCFHVWFIFKQQEVGKPGSETVFYWRFGKWRWDANMGKYLGPWTWYGPGLHWD
jgi:hypothetical protein